MPLGAEVGLGPGHTVLDGDPRLPCKKGQSPQSLAHVGCGQTVGWIKMPLGMEVGLSPGHIVLDGDPVSPRKGAIFGHVYCGQTAVWVRCHLVSFYGKGHSTQQPLNFSAHV